MITTLSSHAASYDEEVQGDSSKALAEKPFVDCVLIDIPIKYSRAFSYLRGIQLFFLDVVRKLNRVGMRDKRILFVTDCTINVASSQGQVSRGAKVEDIAELICNAETHAIGVRMRTRPFAITPQDFVRWNCFHEMSVDFLLLATSAAQYASLLQVMRFVYHTRTHEVLQCRPLRKREVWSASLVLAPDGSRVKKALQCHAITPIPLGGSTSTATSCATRSQETSEHPGAAHVPSQSVALSAAIPASTSSSRQDVSATASTPRSPHSCGIRSFPPTSGAGGHRTALESLLLRLGSSVPLPLARFFGGTVVVPTAATLYCSNLLKSENVPNTSSEKDRSTTRVQPRLNLDKTAATGQPSDASGVFTSCNRERLTAVVARSRTTREDFETKATEPQLRDAELCHFRYSKECQLDEWMLRPNSFALNPYTSRYASSLWSPCSVASGSDIFYPMDDVKKTRPALSFPAVAHQ
ncbi:hypothetical protein MNV84_05691 [Leishmania braziliensis]|nr:hypothetical protein MNV84_05691 [Leishmania braziliensis]